MRKVITFAIIIGIVLLLASCSTQYEQSVDKPISKQMELVCITPHGHQVYSYSYKTRNNYSKTVFVVIRHADGMPLGITAVEH